MRSRGSALIVTMIILAVLTMVGMSSLQLAQADSVTVNRQLTYRTLVACAEAAEKKLWAEYAVQGGSLQQVTPLIVPGTQVTPGGKGTVLSIGHYDADQAGPTVPVQFNELSFKALPAAAMSGGIQELDQSNTFRSSLLGQPYLVVAHCRDARDRQYEVELVVRFGL
jgi:hypothetical protein